MADRPIIFSAPMARAILREIEKPGSGKTQTRRVFVPPKPFAPGDDIEIEIATETIKPRFAVGDRLWVRETWIAAGDHVWTAGDVTRLRGIVPMDLIYRASLNGLIGHGGPWFSPIHMPRWASRLTLAVTRVKIERLQDISVDDVRAEGFGMLSKDGGQLYKFGLADRDGLPGNDNDGWHWKDWSADHKAAFARLWNSINGPDAWDANPWVVAITFKPKLCNIDAASGHG